MGGLLTALFGTSTAPKSDGANATLGTHGEYPFHAAPFTHPGTGNMVFDPAFTNPVYNFFGTSILYPQNKWNAAQPPQIYVSMGTFHSGLGGLTAGTMQLGPLYDTADGSQQGGDS